MILDHKLFPHEVKNVVFILTKEPFIFTPVKGGHLFSSNASLFPSKTSDIFTILILVYNSLKKLHFSRHNYFFSTYAVHYGDVKLHEHDK